MTKITVYIVTAQNAAGLTIMRGFSTIEDAKKCEDMLKELLWRNITVKTVYIDEQL